MNQLQLLLNSLKRLCYSIKRWLFSSLVLLIATLTVGCADTESIRRDREHNNAVQLELAAASKQLVVAEAQARQDFLKTQDKLEVSRQAIVGQHKDVLTAFDRLEKERQQIATERMIDSQVAQGIESFGLLTAVMVPFFLLAWLVSTSFATNEANEVESMLLEYRILAEDTPVLTCGTATVEAGEKLAKLEQKMPQQLRLTQQAVS